MNKKNKIIIDLTGDKGTINITPKYYELDDAEAALILRDAILAAIDAANGTGRAVEIYSGDILVEVIQPSNR